MKSFTRISLIIVTFFVIAYINCVKGYLVGGDDWLQNINSFYSTVYVWSKYDLGSLFQTSYNIYNLFFYFLDKLRFYDIQPVWHLFLYLILSFSSFYLALPLFFKNKNFDNRSSRLLFSILYALNPFTFSFLRHSTGFHPFFIIYVFIPLFFGVVYHYIKNEKDFFNRTLFYFGIVSFFMAISFANVGFLLSLVVFTSLFLFLLSYFKETSKNFLKKVCCLGLFFFCSTMYAFLYEVPILFEFQKSIERGTTPWGDLLSWITYQSRTIFSQFTFNGNYQNHYLFLLQIFFVIFPIFLFVFNKVKSKLTTVFFTLIVVNIFLSCKGIGLISLNLTKEIFTLPIIDVLRSPDKTYIFLPFFILILAGVVYYSNVNPLRNKYLLYFFSIIIFLSIFPIFIGKMLTNYAAGFNKGEDYLSSQSKKFIKIPEVYDYINNNIGDEEQARILSLPYSVINSIGWMNYSMWGYIGIDPLIMIIKKPIVNLNSMLSNTNWNYGLLWNGQKGEESKWFLFYSGMLNVKYILYHKDVAQNFIDQTFDKIKFYEESIYITKMNENEYYNFYKLDPSFFLPHFYTPLNVITSKDEVSTIPLILSKPDYQNRSVIYFENQNNDNQSAYQHANDLVIQGQFEKNTVLEFKRINSIKYRIRIHSASQNVPLVFSEAYSKYWKIYLNDNYQKNISEDVLDNSVILGGNDDFTATIEEVKDYLKQGLVTSIGDEKEKVKATDEWKNSHPFFKYNQNYNVDYISQNIQNSIQNNNLPDGNLFETWFRKPIDNNADHLLANGYANSWLLNVDKICYQNSICQKNSDGSYDFEVVVEFWPQRLYYISLFISGATLICCLGYLYWDFYRRRQKMELALKNDKRNEK